MHTLLITYQWGMYGGLLAITAACVIVPFLKDAHDEAMREKHQASRRTATTIRYLRPTRPRNPIT